MKKQIGIWVAVVLSAAMLLTGCDVLPLTEAEPLTPIMDEAYLYIVADATDPDSKMEVETVGLSDGYEQADIVDANGDTVTFTLDKIDPDKLTMKMSFSMPLMLEGKKIREITIGRGDHVILKSQDGSFYYDVEMRLPSSYNMRWTSHGGDHFGRAVEAYYGGGAMLWMDPVEMGRDENAARMYTMTTDNDPTRESSGTYIIEGDTLTLNEDVGLAKLVFRRDEAKHAWRYDESASARHSLSLAPLFEDGSELVFAHAYEINPGMTYDYCITDADGNTLLAENNVDGFADITALSPTRLCIKKHKPHTETQWRYLDTVTGECSITYYNVVEETAQEIVYLDGSRLVIEEPLGDHKKEIPAYATVVATNVTYCMLTDTELTVEYMEVGGKQRIRAWDRQTGEEIVRPLLIVESGWPNHWSEEPVPRTLNENGTAFIKDIRTSREAGGSRDTYWLYYSGVKCAAVRLDGEYVDLSDALNDGTLTTEGLIARLQADVEAGLATVTSHNGTDITVYQYVQENHLYGVVVKPSATCYSVFVGDTASSLEYIRIESTR